MINGYIILFLLLGVAFAAVHQFAVMASLYWYYWWFDIPMHLWGGIMVGFGVHVLATFKSFKIKANLTVLLLFLTLVTLSWEVFEWSVGLFDPENHLMDTAQDIVLGFSGGLLAHTILRRYRI